VLENEFGAGGSIFGSSAATVQHRGSTGGKNQCTSAPSAIYIAAFAGLAKGLVMAAAPFRGQKSGSAG